jgi:hypothetical protein
VCCAAARFRAFKARSITLHSLLYCSKAQMPKKNAAAAAAAAAAPANFDFLKLVPSFNHMEGKLLFKVVEDTWAASFFSAFVSTVLIFGGINVAIFVAFGINSNKSVGWAIKEYSDNVADACSIVTVAFFAYIYSMIDYGLTLGLEFTAAGRPSGPSPHSGLEHIYKQFSGKPNFIVYATLRMLVVVVPIAAAAHLLVGGSLSFQELLQNYFDEVCCFFSPHTTSK